MNIDEVFYDVFVWIMGKELIGQSPLMSQAGKHCQHVHLYQRKLGTPFDVSGSHPTGGPNGARIDPSVQARETCTTCLRALDLFSQLW